MGIGYPEQSYCRRITLISDQLFRWYIFSSLFSHAKTLFLHIVEGVEAHDDYFKLTRDCCGQLSFSANQKCTTPMRMLALGIAADVVGEMVRMRGSTCLETTVKFARAVVEVFGAEYLRDSNAHDTKKLLAIGPNGFQECSDQSIACIGNGRTVPKICKECTKVTQKRPPSY
ncbi:hypothetical protein ZWY2020_014817 [Hordeum vulgare]|nr:hypothetical protein ZWY2020_014817 [Hordeum vulgare]